jgi:hypothetical protein
VSLGDYCSISQRSAVSGPFSILKSRVQRQSYGTILDDLVLAHLNDVRLLTLEVGINEHGILQVAKVEIGDFVTHRLSILSRHHFVLLEAGLKQHLIVCVGMRTLS